MKLKPFLLTGALVSGYAAETGTTELPAQPQAKAIEAAAIPCETTPAEVKAAVKTREKMLLATRGIRCANKAIVDNRHCFEQEGARVKIHSTVMGCDNIGLN